jgi:hypothetical protein
VTGRKMTFDKDVEHDRCLRLIIKNKVQPQKYC